MPQLRQELVRETRWTTTGGCWHPGSSAGSSESCNCYKIIAKDLNPAKPWEESDKKEPDSLVGEGYKVRKRVQDSAKPKKY